MAEKKNGIVSKPNNGKVYFVRNALSFVDFVVSPRVNCVFFSTEPRSEKLLPQELAAFIEFNLYKLYSRLNGKINARCLACHRKKRRKKTIQGSEGSASPFRNHLIVRMISSLTSDSILTCDLKYSDFLLYFRNGTSSHTPNSLYGKILAPEFNHQILHL